ncbi:MAG: ribonuclease [Myxococcales bacterium]|nr:ribonuclease [Myxococcales bacterium]
MAAPFIHDELILGVDEAGRGPILGPMVMACVALRPRKAASLTRAGVTDSKAFAGLNAHEERQRLIPKIQECADHIAIIVVDVAEIDRRCRENGLNRLEQERAASMIERAPIARRIVCDGERLFRPLQARWPHLEALDRGELKHAAVAAASIVAKVRRDEIWGKICRRYAPEFGDEIVGAGGGYCNPPTKAFLRAYIARYKRLPPEARRSWPWDFARDLLGKSFDPWWDVPDDRPQLALFSTPSESSYPSVAPEPTPPAPRPSRVAAAARRRARPEPPPAS